MPLPVVRAQALRTQDYVENVRGYGVAHVLREARVTAEVAGVVREISPALRIGGRVEATAADGDGGPSASPPLIRLDTRDLEDAIARLEAAGTQIEAVLSQNRVEVASLDRQMEVAEHRMDTARDEEHRIERLVEQKTLPESDLDRQRLAVFALEQSQSEIGARREQAIAQRPVLEAQRAANRVEIRQARRDLERAEIRAPFSGRVLARHVEVGSRVAPGTALFDIIDPARVEVGIALAAGQYDAVDRESRVKVRLRPGGEVVWEGTVDRIDAAIDAESRTFRVWVEVPGVAVAPGAPVIADVTGRHHENVLAVPREAFLGPTVYVARPTGEGEEAVAQAVEPDVTALLPGVAIVKPSPDGGGLDTGDLVVVTNLEDIADGSHIDVVRTGADAGSR